MRTLTLLELIVEWEAIPHEHFIVVRDVTQQTFQGETNVLSTSYYYQRGCCRGVAFNSIEKRLRRSAHKFVELHPTIPLPKHAGATQFCHACTKPLRQHTHFEAQHAHPDAA